MAHSVYVNYIDQFFLWGGSVDPQSNFSWDPVFANHNFSYIGFLRKQGALNKVCSCHLFFISCQTQFNLRSAFEYCIGSRNSAFLCGLYITLYRRKYFDDFCRDFCKDLRLSHVKQFNFSFVVSPTRVLLTSKQREAGG